MDEEFFFPQNVQTSYRLFGMGPKHLRRLVMGIPGLLLVTVATAKLLSVLVALGVGLVLLVAYGAGFCWPTKGENTMFDLWLHVRRLRRVQTIFKREEAEPADQPKSLREALDQYL